LIDNFKFNWNELTLVPDMRRHIRISLVNVVGVMEAGIDGGGLLREFLTEATKAAVDPNRGLFRYDSQNRMYPNPLAKKLFDNYQKHFYIVGRLVGKALYEQTLLELPLAAFFIQHCIESTISSPVDFLATLDPALHKNLVTLKTFEGDLTTLGEYLVNKLRQVTLQCSDY
jgi:ubiquitin-protein ligase E3 C